MQEKQKQHEVSIADFLYEVGTMRKLSRMHRQTLLTDDLSDNISSHTYRVTLIAWFLAQEEHCDPYKVVMMALLHDVGETRSNDHNWIHKRYVKIFEDEIQEEQLQPLPHPFLFEIAQEYAERKTNEALVTKDADLLEQAMLLREYEWQGNKEASIWLRGKKGDGNEQIKLLHFESSKRLSRAIYERNPSDWWKDLWTEKNR